MAKKSLTERLKEKQVRLSKNNGNRLIVYPEKGTTRYRVLPAGEENDWSVELISSFIPDAGEGEKKSFLSPSSFGLKCAVMEGYNRISKSKKQTDLDLAGKIKPKRKQGMAVVKYKETTGGELDKDFGVKILAVPNSIVNDLIDYYTDGEDGGDFTDPKTGCDIKITRKGEMLNTEYSVRVCKPTKLNPLYTKKTYNPEEMVKEILPTYDESVIVAQQIFGSTPSGESKKSKLSKTGKKFKKKSDA